jgi:cell division protein ZapA
MAEQKQDRLNIKLHIYDEEVGVVIDRDDEEYFRLAAKLITERYNAYAKAFKGRQTDHTIALRVLLDIAFTYEKELKNNDTLPYDNVLAKLTKEMEEVLGDSK